MVADAYRFTPSTELYRWTPGVLQHPDQDTAQNLSTHRTSSIFWCRDHQTFLTVPYDCTVVNVADMAAVDELDNWERLKFFHETLGFYSENRAVSVVGHRYPEDKLAATGPTRWVPQLIPDAHQRNGDPAQLGINGTSLLAGDLSILLGLAALSTTPSTVPLTIQECFRPHPLNSNWVTHDRQSFGSRYLILSFVLRTNQCPGQPDRGIVMTIKYDSRFVTEESLKDWESGISSKGPILV
jgi:hypothetical protein